MIHPFPEIPELRALLDALCEESITAEQMKRLEELVLGHPEAEAYYVQYLSLHADLIGHFGALPARTEQALRERARTGDADEETRRSGDKETKPTILRLRAFRSRRFLLGAALTAVAAGLFLAVALWQRSPPLPPQPTSSPEPTDSSVAVLLQAHGAKWEETGLSTRAGAPLPPGWLRLKAGFAIIQFYSGATVILEGPAEFQLISSTEAYCIKGKLRATVPPEAQGFTIGSPKLDLVDRGTEFGLHVGDRTEVHVFQGKVDLYKPGSGREAPAKELTTGQGVLVDGPGEVSAIESDPDAFWTARELAARTERRIRHRHQEWLEASKELRRDPSVLVYFPFEAENSWSHTLADQARGRQKPLDGTIVGCSWVAGRWPGKQGLQFKGVSDRVRFHVPGEFDSLTLMAWVRVDALPNRFNSLFMTDSWDDGEPHWHISRDGKLELGIQGPNRKGFAHYFSREVFTSDRLGQWTHLAVVHDTEAGLVTHYVDGQPVTQEEIKLDIRLRIGNAEIGNWNVTTRPHSNPVRYFSGCIDEFLLFARAVKAEDIKQQAALGPPQP